MPGSDGKNFMRKTDARGLRFTLTLAFVLFALFLIISIWALQHFSLDIFYRISMERKARSAVDTIRTVYSSTEELDSCCFFDYLVTISGENDMYFYIEDSSQTFGISSFDIEDSGRGFRASKKIISLARANLEASGTDEAHFVIDQHKVLVYAARIESEYRETIYLYAVAPIIPTGPTAKILSDLLFIVAIGALLLGVLIAFIYSKRLTKPISEITRKAKELGRGNYSVRFDQKSGYTEVNELAATLSAAANDLEKADALQKDLLANISHDLRTPLTMVKSYAEMVRDISGEDKERRDEHLGVIIEEADRLSDLVGDILLLSKIQSGAMQFDESAFDIQTAAESVLNTYRVLEQENYSFELIKLSKTPIVSGDESRIQQVFSNLISNAVRYSKPGGGHIRVSFEPSGDDRVKCSVSDDGIGIAPEDLETIWSRYQKASRQSGRPTGGSTGLGLSIVREILEYHGAEYGVHSIEGEGSTFWFSMPCILVTDVEG